MPSETSTASRWREHSRLRPPKQPPHCLRERRLQHVGPLREPDRERRVSCRERDELDRRRSESPPGAEAIAHERIETEEERGRTYEGYRRAREEARDLRPRER